MLALILFYVCVYEWPLFLDNKISRSGNHIPESCVYCDAKNIITTWQKFAKLTLPQLKLFPIPLTSFPSNLKSASLITIISC